MTVALIRAVLKSASGIPANDCVNTWYVDGGVGIAPDPGDCFSALEEFYTLDTSSTFNVGDYINDTILRTDGVILEYVLEPQVEPNGVSESYSVDLPPASTAPLPQEVAACVSFVTSDYNVVANPGRFRGRVYIGPLNLNASVDGGANQPARLATAFITTLAEAATNLKAALIAADCQWVIWSRADAVFRAVDRGWVDNEFDTQRRRQWDPTGKTFW